MRLTYERKFRTFRLSGIIPGSKTHQRLIASTAWTRGARKDANRVYETSEPMAAAVFREYADEVAEKFFDRALVKTYSLSKRPLPSFLDKWQRSGARWALTRSRSYLAHAPGAGKSLTAIVVALFARGDGQTIIIVPPSLVENWMAELMKWVHRIEPEKFYTFGVVPETNRAEITAWKSDFLIMPDSMIAKPWVLRHLLRMKKKTVIVDEASRFNEATSIRTIALYGGKLKGFKSSGIVRGARHAVLLDGSPMPNRHMELWVPAYAMAPECIDFMSQRQFGFKYCGAKMNDRGEWEFKHATRPEELRERLQKSFMHVVTEEKLGHSPRHRSIVFLAEDGRSREERAWESKFLSGHAMENPDEELSRGELATHRKNYGLAVVKAAVRYIKERLRSGEKVLVFAWHREVVDSLASALKCEKIMGGVSAEARAAYIKGFRSGRDRCLALNIAAGGRGLNGLQSADRVIFVEPSWTDETNKQCEKRASRKGRDANLPVKSDYLAVRGSIVERVLQANFTKEKRVKRVIG